MSHLFAQRHSSDRRNYATSRPSAVREEHNERVLLKHMGSECLP